MTQVDTLEPKPNRGALSRLISIVDQPADTDDELLRHRIGVVAGYVTIVAPLPLLVQAPGQPLGYLLAIGLPLFSIGNLVLLARTRRFERYVTLMLASGVVFVPIASFVGGGITGSTNGMIFGFLAPAYAMMALGPRRATAWFFAYVAVVVVMILIDPIAKASAPEPPYQFVILGQIINAVVPLTIVFFLLRYTDIQRRRAEERVDALLTNAIPPTIATRLKRGESRIADSYPEATVIFADLAGFTPWAQKTEPERVVAVLDDFFSRFDALAARHKVEKIKTVGDSYMAAVGVPEPRADHADVAVAFARAALAEADDWRAANAVALGLRVGIASGQVVAGVIGVQRLLFDLWGDTVNTAARMEGSGVVGRIQLADTTYERLSDQRGFEGREVEVKGLGVLATYVGR